MDGARDFFAKYGGAIIGIIVAVLLICTRLYELMIGIILICVGAFLGNYIQKNKNEVKDRLKNFIDKI